MKIVEDKTQIMQQQNPLTYEGLITHIIAKYVDDCFFGGEEIREGVRWNPEVEILEWSTEWQQKNKDTNTEQRTLKIVASIASSRKGCLRFMWDPPSINKTGAMPVLDLQLWLETEKREN